MDISESERAERERETMSGPGAAENINTGQADDIMNLFQDYHAFYAEADVTATPIEETDSNAGEGEDGGRVADDRNTGHTDDIMNLFQDYQANNDVDLTWKEREQTISTDSKSDQKLSDIKTLCLRTDLSALVKIDNILKIIEPSLPQQTVNTPHKLPKLNAAKRPGEFKAVNSPNKVHKFDSEKEKNGGSKELSFPDSASGCVVCGLSLKVFRNDASKELVHYLSHGFRVLKEFDILKADDSLFLMCNLCTSLYPKKCQKTFREHLVADHTEKIVEIFRCI